MEWRGGFTTRDAAMADAENKTAPLRLTLADVNMKKLNGYYSVSNGHPLVMHMCPLSGATILTSFELVEEARP